MSNKVTSSGRYNFRDLETEKPAEKQAIGIKKLNKIEKVISFIFE